MIAGTDAPYPGDFQGEGIHHELELLVESGLTPIDAISSATRNASPLMKASNDWGTLESGRLADLLVINGSPDQNIQETHNSNTFCANTSKPRANVANRWQRSEYLRTC